MIPHAPATGGGPVHVIGASGRCGQAVCRALLQRGTPVVALARSPARLHASGLTANPDLTPRTADLTDPPDTLRAALADATHLVCTAHARLLPALLAAAPPTARLVCLGSTRKLTRWPDAHGNGVLAGERALLESGRSGVILHPSMIYGARGENNVQRLAALLRYLPVVPLPAGGKALVQPIYQDDVTACILAALRTPWHGPQAMIIAGAEAVPYWRFTQMVAQAAGLRPRPVLTLPAGLLRLVARATPSLPFLPTISPDEIRRLTEDKAFDTTPMQTLLGVHPTGLASGLARTFAG